MFPVTVTVLLQYCYILWDFVNNDKQTIFCILQKSFFKSLILYSFIHIIVLWHLLLVNNDIDRNNIFKITGKQVLFIYLKQRHLSKKAD